MAQSRVFLGLMFVWFFGWGFVLLKFPRQSYRILAFGREPKESTLKRAKIVGYMGLFFGLLMAIELAFGMIHVI